MAGKQKYNTTVTVGPVRLAYVTLDKPKESQNGVMKWGASVMVPAKDKKTLAIVNAALLEAVKRGMAENTLPKGLIDGKGKLVKARVSMLQMPVRDGSVEFDMEKKGEEYNGMMFFNAYATQKPGLIKQTGGMRVPIEDPDEVYSGMWAFVSVNFYPFKTDEGGQGVAVWLNHVLKYKDDKAFSGRVSVDAAFADVEIPDLDDGTVAEDGDPLA